ncbi:5-formyltetrahydrofolate cyclo-ligase [archaeon]|jgi:5-formyltetrahydrofolate cyclo-ligase|nr:5-formyltetrahydrofolate cyclo-ligase [archaeon]MDP6547754.1 5-formyltetrahydrofolate cyclo-ligase [Candidatus Woesearchaeota archaeon]|tara:strand:- start:48353 stop:48940 length:588 start_codon:yes stop_codon:yes gene_type:complete
MKQALKLKIFEKRKSLSEEYVIEKSTEIKEMLYSLPEFKEAKNIMFYVSFDNEADTHEMIKELLLEKEKTVVVPYTEKDNYLLQISKLEDFNELEKKNFGILEHKEHHIKKFDIADIDLVIVPGVVFDKSGHRIGYGHGYYDRFLDNLEKINKNAVKIGLAYDFQIADKIPIEKHDVPVDKIVTEKRIIRCNTAK